MVMSATDERLQFDRPLVVHDWNGGDRPRLLLERNGGGVRISMLGSGAAGGAQLDASQLPQIIAALLWELDWISGVEKVEAALAVVKAHRERK
jgi:hypothetical protein